MGEAIALVAITLITLCAVFVALGLTTIMLHYGPAVYVGIVAGGAAVQTGVEIPWAIVIGMAAGIATRFLTFIAIGLVLHALGQLARLLWRDLDDNSLIRAFRFLARQIA